ncbi:MAG: hypothetical protein Q8907_12910 [Bacteroidota bacterium]|nr:hypothetical protein [Bacteroidota bacterium]MDP4226178.1 hypothetical protein [Bacteroidota bacterium]MDP4275170.1 hypothetical protein [Bacteroidota bacterium]
MKELHELQTGCTSKKDFFKSSRFLKPFLGIVIGGIAGYLYYRFVGCSTGSCIVTGSPLGSIIFGSLFGLFLVSSPCSGGSCRR